MAGGVLVIFDFQYRVHRVDDAVVDHRVDLHGDVVELYAPEERKHFEHGLLYRTKTGISMVKECRNDLLASYLPSILREYSREIDADSLGEPSWDDQLLKMLGLPNSLAVQSAAHALGLRGNREALKLLRDLSGHSDSKVREAANIAVKNLDRWTRE